MTILDEIIERTRADLVATKEATPEAELRAAIEGLPPPRSFAAALRREEGRGPRIISELKKASPSKGLIRPDFGVVSLATELERHGAAALSVLTEPHYFQGSPEYLRTAVGVVEIPVLRKDFIVDAYQIVEARLWGASAVLLIAAALAPAEFASLHQVATDCGLDVLCEIHNRDELSLVLDGGARIVGINSRDLKTFKTDLNVTKQLIGEIPRDVIRVAESGIRTHEDIAGLYEAGADAFLIGETVMREPRPGLALDKLLGRGA